MPTSRMGEGNHEGPTHRLMDDNGGMDHLVHNPLDPTAGVIYSLDRYMCSDKIFLGD